MLPTPSQRQVLAQKLVTLIRRPSGDDGAHTFQRRRTHCVPFFLQTRIPPLRTYVCCFFVRNNGYVAMISAAACFPNIGEYSDVYVGVAASRFRLRPIASIVYKRVSNAA